MRLGLAFTGLAFVLGSLGYLALNVSGEPVFGGLFRMFMYHEQNPFQYIALVAIVFGFTGVLWVRFFGRLSGWRRWGTIIATLWMTVVFASIPGGVLWAIYDMQAGFVPKWPLFGNKLWWGLRDGFFLGWLVILLSFPYNVAGTLLGAFVLHKLPILLLPNLAASR